jgi:anti-sigma regulatory factor (Ser/Thr protein kinase)
VPRRWRLGEVAEATVQADQDRLTVALDALLENAIAHTGPDDRIEISTHLDRERDDEQVVFAVADSGSGIPATELDRIFDRFARADRHRGRETGGFGLGLPIVRAIAEAHHGSVRVNSSAGHGSTFEIRIPRSFLPDPAGSGTVPGLFHFCHNGPWFLGRVKVSRTGRTRPGSDGYRRHHAGAVTARLLGLVEGGVGGGHQAGQLAAGVV